MCCDWGPVGCRGDAEDPLPLLPLTPVRSSARQFKFLWGSQLLTAILKPPSRHSHRSPLVIKRYFCHLQTFSSPHPAPTSKGANAAFPWEVTQGWRCPCGTGVKGHHGWVSSAISKDTWGCTAGLARESMSGISVSRRESVLGHSSHPQPVPSLS